MPRISPERSSGSVCPVTADLSRPIGLRPDGQRRRDQRRGYALVAAIRADGLGIPLNRLVQSPSRTSTVPPAVLQNPYCRTHTDLTHSPVRNFGQVTTDRGRSKHRSRWQRVTMAYQPRVHCVEACSHITRHAAERSAPAAASVREYPTDRPFPIALPGD